jgi:signal peptidase I
MVPTLLIGDLILVNKYTYGIRLPVINRKLVEINQPARGDVMVFRYPHNPSQDYIKRVIALPGDRVAYINRQLMLNGQPVPAQALPRYLDDERLQHYAHFSEKLGTVEHRIIMNEGAGMPPMRAFAHTHPDACKYSVEGVACVVPAGHYFVMGDNRDNSEDSRYWGFVPDENIVGRAFFIWMSLRGWRRLRSGDLRPNAHYHGQSRLAFPADGVVDRRIAFFRHRHHLPARDRVPAGAWHYRVPGGRSRCADDRAGKRWRCRTAAVFRPSRHGRQHHIDIQQGSGHHQE